MNIERILKISRMIAVVPLIFGTVVFCAWVVSRFAPFILLGVLPLYIIVPLNIISVVTLAVVAVSHRQNQKFRSESWYRLLMTLGLLLAAYPLAFLYFWTSFNLISTSRLMVINSSGRDLQETAVTDPAGNITAIGLLPRDKTIKCTFKAKGEGAVYLIFKDQPVGKECVVFAYVTGGLGEKGTVEILPALNCTTSR